MSLRVRRHYKLFVALTALATLLVLGLGDQRIVAYSVADDEQVLQQAASYGSSVVRFFDTVIEGTPVLVAQAGHEDR